MADVFEKERELFFNFIENLKNRLKGSKFSDEAEELGRVAKDYIESEEHFYNIERRLFPSADRYIQLPVEHFADLEKILKTQERSLPPKPVKKLVMKEIYKLRDIIKLREERKIDLPKEYSAPNNFEEARADFNRLSAKLIDYLEKNGFREEAKSLGSSSDSVSASATKLYKTVLKSGVSKSEDFFQVILSSGQDALKRAFYELSVINNYVFDDDSRRLKVAECMKECSGRLDEHARKMINHEEQLNLGNANPNRFIA